MSETRYRFYFQPHPPHTVSSKTSSDRESIDHSQARHRSLDVDAFSNSMTQRQRNCATGSVLFYKPSARKTQTHRKYVRPELVWDWFHFLILDLVQDGSEDSPSFRKLIAGNNEIRF